MFLELHAPTLFGNQTYNISVPSTRDVRSTDRKSVVRYITHKYQYLINHKFAQRIEQLKDSWDPTLAEQLDRDWQRASQHAAQKCTKKPNIAFVRRLASLRTKKNILQRVISQYRNGRTMSDAIAFHARHGTDFLIPRTIEDCKVECSKTQAEIRNLERDASTHRQTELKTQLATVIDSGDKVKATRLRHIIRAENTKRMFKKLQNIRGYTKSGLTRLDIPADLTDRNYQQCTEWITLDTPKDIEKKLRERNQRHFGQAQGTFPTIPPFAEWVNWSASTHTSELLLEGSFSNDDLSSLEQDLLKYMEAKTSLDSISDGIDRSEWEGKICAWNENTSTSPSGFHLGHSKVLLAPHDLPPDSAECLTLETNREHLITWQVQLLHLALINRYSYDRWKTIVNVMILKEENNFKIHRLRVIHLYEHDFNLILGVKWRQLIHNGLQEHTINSSQFGGLPGRDAITPTMIEELQYEISRASRRPLVHLDYDATSCYDRIIPSLASLISRGFGMHRNICFVHATTLEEARYLLKTQLGISDDFYTHSTEFPIFGTGQGSANSPAIWCIISSVLFDVYEGHAKGAYFQCPKGTHSINIFMVGFVDDTSGSVNDFLQSTIQSPDHYIALATNDAQLWNNVLLLSGGALELTKCSYHFMYFDFTLLGHPIVKPGKISPELQITFQPGSTPQPLAFRTAYQSHKTLGTHKEPAGNQLSAWKALLKNSTNHLSIVNRSPLDPLDAWTYYHAIFIPSTTYPIVAGYVHPRQLDKIDQKARQSFLPKLGYNRNIPIPVVYGSSEYAGIEFRQFKTEQGISHIKMFLKCWRSRQIPGKLLRIALSWAQLVAGIRAPILENVHVPLPHLDPMRWLPSVRQFLSSIGGTLELDEDMAPPLQRINDCFLMDYFITQHTLKASQLRQLNACRLYLGVTLLSDITLPDGSNLDTLCFRGVQPVLSSHKGLMPYQEKPAESAWQLWRRCLTRLLLPKSMSLAHPLGAWHVTGPVLYRQWKFLYSKTDRQLYVFKDVSFDVYRQSNQVYEIHSSSTTTPADVIPVSILSTPSGLRIYGLIHATTVCPPPPVSTFLSYLHHLPPWEYELLSMLSLPTDIFTLCHAMSTQQPIYVTSDGSVSDSQSSFAWVLSTSDGQRLATCNGPACGFQCTSYRSEGYGLLSILRFVLQAYRYTSILPFPRMKIHTDSESVLTKLSEYLQFTDYFPNVTLDAEWDVLQAIVSSIREFPVRPSLNYVQGHQDKHTPFYNLDLPAQLNVEADKLADQYVPPPHLNFTDVSRICGNSVQLKINNMTITSKYANVIRNFATTPTIRTWIMTKEKWSLRLFNTIDWKIHGICVRKFYRHKRFIVKYVHDWLPLGKLLSHYKDPQSTTCPSCSTTIEDRTHFLWCSFRQRWKSVMISDLRAFSAKFVSTEPMTLLLDAITGWLSNTPLPISLYNDTLQQIIQQQEAVGWGQLFLGRFVTAWSDYFRDQDANSSVGRRWVIGVIRIIWTQVLQNWDERNGKKHGIDKASREAALVAQTKLEIEQLYLQRNKVLPRDRDKFYTTVTQHYEEEPSSLALRQWLNTWKPALLASMERNKQLGIGNTRSIASYFRLHQPPI
jgi:hypothetical protein